jgi:hypothetical protein
MLTPHSYYSNLALGRQARDASGITVPYVAMLPKYPAAFCILATTFIARQWVIAKLIAR